MTPSGSGNDSHHKRRWPAYVLSWKVGLPLAALLLAVSGVMAYRESQLSGLPDIGDPFDLDEFYAIDVPPEENAWPDYEAAFALSVPAPRSARQEIDATLDQGWHMATPFVRLWLEDNRPALVRWRAGAEKATCLRVHPRDIRRELIIGPYGEAERLVHLARLEALRVEAEGEPRLAWGWYRALFRFSRHRGMNDNIAERRIGVGCHGCLLCPIAQWAAHETRTPDELQAALVDVRNDYQLTAPLSTGLKCDYLYEIDDIDHLDELRESYAALASYKPEFAFPSPVQLFVSNQPEVMRRLFRHQIANVLPHCDKLPRDQPPSPRNFLYYDVLAVPDLQLLSAAEFHARVSNSSVAKIVLLGDGPVVSHVCEQAGQAALEITLAAEWHRRVHGELPEELSQLVTGGILSEVPDDPWSRVPAPLRYERDPANTSRAKVWSVGRNLIDDGGRFVPGALYDDDLGLWIGGEPDSE